MTISKSSFIKKYQEKILELKDKEIDIDMN